MEPELPVSDQPYIGTDRGHDRETLLMLQRAVRNRWNVPDEMKAKAPALAAKIAVEGATERERLRALEVLAAFDRDNIAALVNLDKVERLEADKNTENVSGRIEIVYVNKHED